MSDPRDAINLAERIAANPEAASDADKLRSVADYLDAIDRRLGNEGTDVQTFLRALALRLEVCDTP